MAVVVARDHGQCHICHHWAAYSADHIVPVTEEPGKQWDLNNLKAVHSWPKGCPDCSIAAGKPVYCNSVRGGYSIERARRIISEWTGLTLTAEVKPFRPEGREW